MGIREPRAFSFLIGLLLCLALGSRLMSRALEEPASDTPPALAIVAAGAAIVLLMAGKLVEVSDDSDNSANEKATMMSAASSTWVEFMKKYWRALAVLSSLLLTFLILLQLPRMQPYDTYDGVVISWAYAAALYLLAMAKMPAGLPDWRTWGRERWKTIIPVALIVLLAFLLRVWRIADIPHTVSGDEGSQGLEAIRVIDGTLRNPFTTGWLGVPTMSFFLNSVTIELLGRNVPALRLPWVVVGTSSVLFTFFLVRRARGTPLALATSALLATYHYHIHFSRLGSNQIADPFFMALALLFLYRALERKSRLDWAMTGVVTGLALYFYAGARLTSVVIAAVLAYEFVRGPRRFWEQHGQGVVVALAAALIVGAPMLQYAFRFPDDFNARLNQVGIIQSGWIDRAVEARGESVAAVLFDQFRRAALAFNFYPDRTVWYGLPRPLLSPLFGILFLLGLGFGTLRLLGRGRDERLAPFVAWWWCGMIIGGMLTESPPSSQRLITLSVPVCFFIALAMWEVLELMHKGIVGIPGKVFFGMMVFLFAVSSIVTYFLEYTPRRLYGGPYAELATDMAPYLNEVSQESRIYFVGAPWMYWGIATFPYLVPDADAVDVTIPVADLISFDAVAPDKEPVFIFIPQRFDEREAVEAAFPELQERTYYSPVDGRVMAVVYTGQ